MMNKYLLLIVAFASPLVFADRNYGDIYADRVGTVIDGDSFKVDINSWPSVIGKGITVRINGIDTPELRGKCQAEKAMARQAKEFAVIALRSARTVELRNIKRGKYFRVLADVYLDGVSLGDALLTANLARRYGGGKRRSWCN